jgi:L-sorbose 1-phosphate reductase
MSDIINDYRNGTAPLPKKMLAWRMYGAGLENFGRDGKPEEVPVPEYGHGELLARVDAIGICFSDVKLITQGNAHARITGRDLQKEPVIPGHEVSLTIVGVGDDLKDRFSVGNKYVVQADVFYKGASMAYGYVLPGGMAQFGVIGKELLEGDEGCYLLPVQSETGYSEAALAEPWACVVAAYRIKARRELKEGGTMLVVGDGEAAFSGLLGGSSPKPVRIVASGVSENVFRQLTQLAPSSELIKASPISADTVLVLAQERTGARGFDDITVIGVQPPQLVEALAGALARDGILNIVAKNPLSEKIGIDIGRVHYERWRYIGSSGNDAAEGYRRTRDSELVKGGTAWFIGAAGPMGQMHVQWAVAMPNHPSRILATDVDNARMATLKNMVDDAARQKGIEILYVNPLEESFDDAVEKLTGGRGFDDIICMAPVVKVMEDAAPYLGEGGMLNIFAGVIRGTMGRFDLSDTYLRQTRWVGSSGSLISDLLFTLEETEAGRLPAAHSLAAIGGMQAMAEGVEAVKTGRFPGKTVIFPQIPELSLMGIDELRDALPNVYSKLESGKFWTREAEEELLRTKLPR